MLNSQQVLVDYTGPIRMKLDEDSSSSILMAEGKCGQCDAPTSNGRVYSRKIMEREIAKLKKKIATNSAVGSVDHPGDGKSRITDIGHVIKDIWIEDDGSINGKFQIIEGTSKGRDLAAVLRAGVSVGMSSRGLGSIASSGADGKSVVGEDYRLSTFDFVVEPAVSDAFPKMFSEDVDTDLEVSASDLRARFPDQVKEIEESAYAVAKDTTESIIRAESDSGTSDIKDLVESAISEQKDHIRNEVAAEERSKLVDEFAVKLVRALKENSEKLEESVRSKLASDPSIADAKLKLEQISNMVSPYKPSGASAKVISEKDKEISELAETIESYKESIENSEVEVAGLTYDVQRLKYELYLERAIADRSDKEAIKTMVGDLDLVKSPDDLVEKVQVAIEESTKLSEKAKADFDKSAELDKEKIKELEARVAELTDVGSKDSNKTVSEDVDKLIAAAVRKELKKHKAAVEKLELKNKTLSEALETAIDTIKVKKYAEDRLIGHPNRDNIIEKVLSGDLTSTNEVNELAESTDIMSNRDNEGAERVRRFFGRGKEAHYEHETRVLEESQDQVLNESLNELGISLEDLAPIGKRIK